MTTTELLALARRDFGSRLDLVGDDQWLAPTPNTQWNVRQLVTHVIAGNNMSVALLDGATAEVAAGIVGDTNIEGDLGDAFSTSADAQAAAFDRPGAMETLCHHPMLDLTGSQLLGFRIADFALHAWDLARAIGVADDLNPTVVEGVYEQLSPLASIIGTIGVFGEGPSGLVGDDQPLHIRLLDLAGRRP